jgi:hypothetical protein
VEQLLTHLAPVTAIEESKETFITTVVRPPTSLPSMLQRTLFNSARTHSALTTTLPVTTAPPQVGIGLLCAEEMFRAARTWREVLHE